MIFTAGLGVIFTAGLGVISTAGLGVIFTAGLGVILMARALTADAGKRLCIFFFAPFSVFKWALVDCLGKLYLINLGTLTVLMCS